MSTPSDRKEDVNRLHDIEVEEVSLVDRAANKHRFLIVKRSAEMDETNTQTESTDNNSSGEEAATPETGAYGSTNTDTGSMDESGTSENLALTTAVSALESLTADVEALESLSEEQASTQLAALADQLSRASEQLKESSDASTTADAATTNQQLEGKPASEKPELASVIQALRTAIRQVENTAKPSHQEKADTQEETQSGNTGIDKKLSELLKEMRTLATAVKEQQQRMNKIEKSVGLPNSEQSGERPRTQKREEEGWPMDLNKPFDRESVDKAISFHDV